VPAKVDNPALNLEQIPTKPVTLQPLQENHPRPTPESLSTPPQKALNCTPSERISLVESSPPRAIAVSHNQYPLAQQPFYLLTSTPATHEFYSAQSIVTHSIPVSLAPVGVQQHVQLVQQ
jgi:hypothetical protein